jgi:hypothetical protein
MKYVEERPSANESLAGSMAVRLLNGKIFLFLQEK